MPLIATVPQIPAPLPRPPGPWAGQLRESAKAEARAALDDHKQPQSPHPMNHVTSPQPPAAADSVQTPTGTPKDSALAGVTNAAEYLTRDPVNPVGKSGYEWPCDRAAALSASGALQLEGRDAKAEAWPFDREAALNEAMGKSWSAWTSLPDEKKQYLKQMYAGGTSKMSEPIDHICALIKATDHWPTEARLYALDVCLCNAAQVRMEMHMAEQQHKAEQQQKLAEQQLQALLALQKDGAIITNADGTAIPDINQILRTEGFQAAFTNAAAPPLHAETVRMEGFKAAFTNAAHGNAPPHAQNIPGDGKAAAKETTGPANVDGVKGSVPHAIYQTVTVPWTYYRDKGEMRISKGRTYFRFLDKIADQLHLPAVSLKLTYKSDGQIVGLSDGIRDGQEILILATNALDI